MAGSQPVVPALPMADRFRGGRFVALRIARQGRRSPRVSAVAVVMLLASLLAPVAASLTPAPATAASYQDWPMFLQNPARTAATVDPKLSVASAPTLKLKFAFATGGAIATSVSIVGTTAYVGSWDGFEYAVNTSTGAMIWKQNLGVTVDQGCNPVNTRTGSSTPSAAGRPVDPPAPRLAAPAGRLSHGRLRATQFDTHNSPLR